MKNSLPDVRVRSIGEQDEEYNCHTQTMGTSTQDNPYGQYSEPGSFNANYHDESHHDELSEQFEESGAYLGGYNLAMEFWTPAADTHGQWRVI